MFFLCCPVFLPPPPRSAATCSLGGVEYQEDETFYDDSTRPCHRFRCSAGQVVLEEDESLACMPAPDATCTAWHMEGRCCPKWDCEERECRAYDVGGWCGR